MNFSDEDVAEILRILDGTPATELEIETDRFRLTLQRGADGGWSQQRETLRAASRLDDAAVAAVETTTATSSDTPEEDDGLLSVKAPIVGTFYRSPQPGAPAFVEIGSRVEPDTVVAIIEVMKLMNSVPAGVAGEVVEIRAENAELVQQGACLMRVRPDA